MRFKQLSSFGQTFSFVENASWTLAGQFMYKMSSSQAFQQTQRRFAYLIFVGGLYMIAD